MGQQPPERLTDAARDESFAISGTAWKQPRRHFKRLRWNSVLASCNV